MENNNIIIGQIILLVTTLAGFAYQLLKTKSEASATRLALRERDEALLKREEKQHQWDVEDRALIAADLKKVVDQTAADLALKTKTEIDRLKETQQETIAEVKDNTALTQQIADANGLGTDAGQASQTIKTIESVTKDTNIRVKDMEKDRTPPKE